MWDYRVDQGDKEGGQGDDFRVEDGAGDGGMVRAGVVAASADFPALVDVFVAVRPVP